MKAIVTGGCGFIGSHLVDLLVSQGLQVTVLDNLSSGRRENLQQVENQVQVVECDISREGDWQQLFAGVDYVFHLAALADIVPSIKDPTSYFRTNVDGTFYVLEASRRHQIKRFVYAASSSCYGIPTVYPTPEDADIQTKYPYALTKYLGEEMVLHWSEVYQLPALALRLFNVYGPRSRTSGTYGAVFGVFLAQKLAGKPFTVVGDGQQTRDFTYVTDVAEAFLAAANSSYSGSVYNVGSGRTVSVLELVALLKGPVTYIPKRPGEPACTFAKIDKIKHDIGWTPRVTFEEGVANILKEINYWTKAPVWTPETIAEETKEWFRCLS